MYMYELAMSNALGEADTVITPKTYQLTKY